MIHEHGMSFTSLLMKVLVVQSCLTLCDPMDSSLPGFSVHGMLQARILEWVAIPFSRRSSQLRIEPRSPYILLSYWKIPEVFWIVSFEGWSRTQRIIFRVSFSINLIDLSSSQFSYSNISAVEYEKIQVWYDKLWCHSLKCMERSVCIDTGFWE